MIQLFLKMLREIYEVDEQRLRVFLYCYPNQDIENLIDYWVKTTKIDRRQFSKPYVRRDFSEAKSNKMRFGLVHVRYNDKKLLAKIKVDIDDLKRKLT